MVVDAQDEKAQAEGEDKPVDVAMVARFCYSATEAHTLTLTLTLTLSVTIGANEVQWHSVLRVDEWGQ